MFTEYFDFDDPCVYDDANDHGDNEDKLSAWNFLKGIGYDDRVKDPITGHDRVERREIVSHNTPNFLLLKFVDKFGKMSLTTEFVYIFNLL